MIARSPVAEQRDDVPEDDWREALREAWRTPRELLDALAIDPASLPAGAADGAFPMLVPRAYAARMRPGDPRDPLLLQVLPRASEDIAVAGFNADPLEETPLLDGSGLLRKYRGRALLLLAGNCAVNCRYCFRRAFPYREAVGPAALQQALTTIAGDHGISEVILSGGDPLVLTDARLGTVLDALGRIEHVSRVRIHTRVPVVLPQRITTTLCNLLHAHRAGLSLVIHANHARELDDTVADALVRLRDAGATLLNQSVLLRDVNDDGDTLAALSERLFACGVLPYYVHLLDAVAGAAHFEVSAPRARELESMLRARLPGYLVPRFVREVAGAASKLPL